MEFLKAILGDELFTSFSEKVSAYNESNPDKAVKIADLSTGLYVDKNKHDAVASERDGYKGMLSQRDADMEELKKKAGSA